MAALFYVDRTRITRHVNNILLENELPNSVCAENALTASDGKKYLVKYYNLDMIIAVGYRVNSRRGTLFRQWANKILKQYLLKGYAINQDTIMAYQSNILQLEATVWLSANEIALLFNRDPKTIRKHINNVFEENEVDINSNTHFLRVVGVKQKVAFATIQFKYKK